MDCSKLLSEGEEEERRKHSRYEFPILRRQKIQSSWHFDPENIEKNYGSYSSQANMINMEIRGKKYPSILTHNE
jgi:hypothetical protein